MVTIAIDGADLKIQVQGTASEAPHRIVLRVRQDERRRRERITPAFRALPSRAPRSEIHSRNDEDGPGD